MPPLCLGPSKCKRPLPLRTSIYEDTIDGLQLNAFGAPSAVIELAGVDEVKPGTGQVVVPLEAAPINPSGAVLVLARHCDHA